MEQAAKGQVNGCDEPSLLTKETCKALGHMWQDVKYSFYNQSETQKRLSGFVPRGSPVKCSIIEHHITGYARSEILFQVVGEILQEEGVKIGLSCDVTELEHSGKQGRIRAIAASALSGHCSLSGTREFDRVVVAASAASVPLLAKVDPMLGDHLIGVKGYGLLGGSGSQKIPKEQSGRGLHFMDESKRFQAAYARATQDLRIKVWGGHDVSAEEEGLKPPYAFCKAAEADRIFRQGPPCAQDLVDPPETQRLAGMRPVPSIGAVPLVKTYRGELSNLLLNTGGSLQTSSTTSSAGSPVRSGRSSEASLLTSTRLRKCEACTRHCLSCQQRRSRGISPKKY